MSLSLQRCFFFFRSSINLPFYYTSLWLKHFPRMDGRRGDLVIYFERNIRPKFARLASVQWNISHKCMCVDDLSYASLVTEKDQKPSQHRALVSSIVSNPRGIHKSNSRPREVNNLFQGTCRAEARAWIWTQITSLLLCLLHLFRFIS